MLLSSSGPLALKWNYIPKMLPWIFKYFKSSTKKNMMHTAKYMHQILNLSLDAYDDMFKEIDTTNLVEAQHMARNDQHYHKRPSCLDLVCQILLLVYLFLKYGVQRRLLGYRHQLCQQIYIYIHSYNVVYANVFGIYSAVDYIRASVSLFTACSGFPFFFFFSSFVFENKKSPADFDFEGIFLM